jgi:hypothetical protein
MLRRADALQHGKTSKIPIVVFTGLPLENVCRGCTWPAASRSPATC